MNSSLIIVCLWVLGLSLMGESFSVWKESSVRHRPMLWSGRGSGAEFGGVEYDADDARIVIDSILESTLNKIYGESVSSRSSGQPIQWIKCSVDAIIQFYELYGHVLVPPTFVLPDDSSVRDEHRGFPLGDEVVRIRQLYFQPHHKVREEDYYTLRKLGFEFKHSVAQFKLRHLELSLFKRKEGHLMVRRDYVVPDDDPHWPQPHHGVKLGQVVKNIRDKGTFHEYRGDLQALGLLYDAKLARVMLAIETWNKLHRIPIDDLPYRWEVPQEGAEGCEQWPQELRGMKLGALLYRVKKKGALGKYHELLSREGGLTITSTSAGTGDDDEGNNP